MTNTLQDHVGYVHVQREARRRADHIIAALTERIPELEAPPQSAQEAQSVAERASVRVGKRPQRSM